MSRNEPASIEELIEYTKRKLGEDTLDDSTIEIDVTDEQCNDLVADTLQLWKTYAMDGSIECFFVIPTITGTTLYQLPQSTIAVYGYVPHSEWQNMFSLDYQMKTYLGLTYKTFDITTIEITKEYLALMDMKLGKKYAYSFNGITKMLNIYAGSETGTSIVVMASKFVDEAPNIFNEIWVKKYMAVTMELQWAKNLSKFDGVKLPGSITINWRDTLASAKEEKKSLEEELMTKWSRPVRMKRG